MSVWPPPPDLESIRDLVRAADPEGHIAEGAHADEYEPEEEAIFAAIAHLKTSEITTPILQSILEQVWRVHEDTDTRAIDNFVVRLRRYIEDDPANPQHLVTVRGIGYRFLANP